MGKLSLHQTPLQSEAQARGHTVSTHKGQLRFLESCQALTVKGPEVEPGCEGKEKTADLEQSAGDFAEWVPGLGVEPRCFHEGPWTTEQNWS